MRGEILHYDVSQGIGFIAADDGARYMFARNELRQAQRVGKGTKVDFHADGQNARDVYIVDPHQLAGTQPGPAGGRVPSIRQGSAGGPPAGAEPQQPWSSATPLQAHMAISTADKGIWGYFMHCCTKGYADFRGRARRKEYWSFYLFYVLAVAAAVLVGVAIDGAAGNLDGEEPIFTGVLGGIAILFFFLPAIAVTVRRFHDLGLSGWLYLLFFVLSFAYIGGIIILVLTLLPSQKHDNKWGPVPAGIRV